MSRGRILVLCIYPPDSVAGQRFRFEQYLPALREAGFHVDQAPFWDPETLSILYSPGHTRQKVVGVLRGFMHRARLIPTFRTYDHVFIHLEAAPLGPPLIERVLFAMDKRVVFDIDDAIFLSVTSKVNWLAAPLRWRSKIAWISRRSHRVTAVNPYIRDWARQYSKDVRVLPTTIDTAYHRRTSPRVLSPGRLRLGWTGTQSTARYLEVVRPALVELQKTHDFSFRVICNIDPGFPELAHYEFLRWEKATEIADLEAIDIGLMPVIHEQGALGKVGFKAIQYGALEIPTVASDVGSGRDVVSDGVTGYLVDNDISQWVARLRTMLDDRGAVFSMGRAAYEHITSTYTVAAQTPNYLALFD